MPHDPIDPDEAADALERIAAGGVLEARHDADGNKRVDFVDPETALNVANRLRRRGNKGASYSVGTVTRD